MRNRVTDCVWDHAQEPRWGFGGFRRKVRRVEASHRTRRFDFWGSLTRDEFARYGRRAIWGPDEKDSIERLSLSLCRRTFKLNGNKRFVPEQRSRYVFFEFRDSYVLCIYVTNIRCPFRTWPYLATVHLKKIYLKQRKYPTGTTLWIRVNLGAMAMKKCSTHSK